MKEIRTIRMVEQTEVKFIANDGKEFTGINAESNCAAYERQQNKKAVEYEFSKLDARKITFPLIEWVTCETDIWRIRLECKKDYYSMIDYFTITHGTYLDNNIEMPCEFPCNMTVLEYCDSISDYPHNLEVELMEVLLSL